MTMSDDIAICKVVQSTQNTLLWTQTSEDKYKKCTTSSICRNLAINPASTEGTFSDTADATTAANWTNPLADDDEKAPFCTAHSDTTNFACSKIKCLQQRLMDTGDTATDFQLSPPDEIHIRPGRAMLGINTLNCSSCAYMPVLNSGNDIVITVRANAYTLLASAALALTSLALFTF